MLEYYEQTAKKYIEVLEENDKKEENDELGKYTKEEVKSKLKAAKERIEELTEMAKEIEENGTISITDQICKTHECKQQWYRCST